MFAFAPFFESPTIPMMAKAGLSLFVTVVLFPMASSHFEISIPHQFFPYSLLVIQEVIIGLIIGVLCTIMLTAFSLSGELYSFQMGLGIINVFDPLSEREVPIIGQFVGLIALLIFITWGGHHMLLEAIYKSFKVLPILPLKAVNSLASSVVDIFSKMFLVAFMIGSPIIGVLFIITMVMGILAKATPQMNVMMVGWPIQIVVGIITLILLLPLLYDATISIFNSLFNNIDTIIRNIGGIK
ncbi:MAG: flagellar biosynthetic protein FliR [bacterium]|nr:flagellar biosynthetic protein FliR [bacterium]